MNTLNDMISRMAAIDALIDTNLKRNLDSVCDGDMNRTRRAAQRVIAQVPAMDAVPVVHGRWSEKRWMTDDDWGVINHRAIVCSACKGEIADGEQTCYCPNCGAKMDGEQRDENGMDA